MAPSSTRSIVIALAFVLLAVVLVVAHPWRDRPDGAAIGSDAAPADVEAPPLVARVTGPVTQPAPPPAEAAAEAGPPQQDLKAVFEGVDPLLRERNVITRAPPPNQTGPEFVELELRFGGETADASWSRDMETRILDQLAQINGLKLVSLVAECRTTVCRVKLFHPPRTNALSSLDKFLPISTNLGLAPVVQAATLGENGVPISLLYFQRRQDGTP